jgi:hypothetical protein
LQPQLKFTKEILKRMVLLKFLPLVVMLKFLAPLVVYALLSAGATNT